MPSARLPDFWYKFQVAQQKMSRVTFNRAMKSLPSFRSLMLAYAQALFEQVLVSAACNGRHSLNERLARWLLMMRDRSDADVMPITRDLLAELLGVQRPSLTREAAKLEQGWFDPAWSAADYDPRPKGPDQSIVRMLSTCSRARRVPPSAFLR